MWIPIIIIIHYYSALTLVAQPVICQLHSLVFPKKVQCAALMEKPVWNLVHGPHLVLSIGVGLWVAAWVFVSVLEAKCVIWPRLYIWVWVWVCSVRSRGWSRELPVCVVFFMWSFAAPTDDWVLGHPPKSNPPITNVLTDILSKSTEKNPAIFLYLRALTHKQTKMYK